MAEEKIRAAEIVINDLFGDKYLFEVPDYQRPFVWEKENFEQLFDDIKSEIDKNQEQYNKNLPNYESYFLGSIVLYQKELRSSGYGKYEIIDGRQRLVSLAILMAVIRDLAFSVNNQKAKDTMQKKICQEENEYEGTQASVRIAVKENEKEFFKKYILTSDGFSQIRKGKDLEKSLKRLRQKLNRSENHMLDAIEVFWGRFHNSENILDEDLLSRYIQYLLQKVIVVAVKTDSLESAFRLFKTLNKRGVEIGSADILKSENISTIQEFERSEYAEKWEDIEEEISLETGIKLETLINFIRIIEIPGRQQREVFQDFEDKFFSKDPSRKGKIFIDYLDAVKNIYTENIENGELSTEESTKKIYYYNLMSIMRKFVIFNDWMATIIHFVRKFGDDLALFEFLTKLEKTIFLDWLTGSTQERRVARVYQIIKIVSESNLPEEVINHSVLNDEIKARRVEFEQAIDDINFYNRGSKKLSKYILLRLDMERIDNRNKKVDYDGEISVEHILPENPENSYWSTGFSENDLIEWTDRLGNLTLLDGRKNSKAANKPFPEKKIYFFQRRRGSKNLVQRNSFELTNELDAYSEWTMETLKQRHEKLKREAFLIWMR
jgi:uncharacterized protein with ParB-like and HNH nuclease domain